MITDSLQSGEPLWPDAELIDRLDHAFRSAQIVPGHCRQAHHGELLEAPLQYGSVAERRSSEVKAYLVTCDDNRLVSSSQSL